MVGVQLVPCLSSGPVRAGSVEASARGWILYSAVGRSGAMWRGRCSFLDAICIKAFFGRHERASSRGSRQESCGG